MAQHLASTRVLLVEPNSALRSAILDLLTASHIEVETCESLDQVMMHSSDGQETVALVAWQAMGGLLADEHRDHLLRISNRVRLLVMVPRRWSRLLDATDLRAVVAGIVPKPFEADELLAAISAARLALTPVSTE
jgi:DNA-binding response OmpR family regulator